MCTTKIMLSTGHKELDEILKKNGIVDQEEQKKQKEAKSIEEMINEFKKLKESEEKGLFPSIKRFMPKGNDFRPDDCLIQKAIQSEINAGVPEHKRTKFFFISCPCKRCNPYFM